jgi:small GTP-binding protein
MTEKNVDEDQLIYKQLGDDGEIVYKIIIVGDPSVGKTSLIRKFVSKKMETQYIPTVGVDITKEELDLNIGGKTFKFRLMIWDLAGQAQFHLLHKVYCNGANGIAFVFDLTKAYTFSNVKNWHQMTQKHGLNNVPIILVGNKADLKEERTISMAHVDHLKEQLNCQDYFETSALLGQNVKEMFETIAKRIYEQSNH